MVADDDDLLAALRRATDDGDAGPIAGAGYWRLGRSRRRRRHGLWAAGALAVVVAVPGAVWAVGQRDSSDVEPRPAVVASEDARSPATPNAPPTRDGTSLDEPATCSVLNGYYGSGEGRPGTAIHVLRDYLGRASAADNEADLPSGNAVISPAAPYDGEARPGDTRRYYADDGPGPTAEFTLLRMTPGWVVSGYTSCVQIDDDQVRERVRIEWGHCWLLPVTFDGQEWNVPVREQFGSGGLAPAGWRGDGVMVRDADDRARFFDDGGAVVRFVPADSEAASLANSGCY